LQVLFKAEVIINLCSPPIITYNRRTFNRNAFIYISLIKIFKFFSCFAPSIFYCDKRRQLKMAGNVAEIQFVPVKAAAGYLAGYADLEFIDELNTFTLPMLGAGNYRAFEIIGDSMLPTTSGSVIVGEKVEGIDDVKTSNTYIVVSRNEGIVYKRVLKNNRSKNKVTLVSDNPQYEPYHVNSEDIMELWQAQMIIARANVQQRWDVNQLASLVNNLQDQVSNLKKKMN
jgi:SOS-response transcriptional repressor LexA